MTSPGLSIPGAYRPQYDRSGSLSALARALPDEAFLIVDAHVARLHPRGIRALERRARWTLRLAAGERAKTTASLDRICRASLELTRQGTIVCVGGGTLGDLATVAAHVIKRGVRLIHVPSTLLAAVDSSVGGKGALHAGFPPVKNAVGVFHYADETWLCPELFQTLPEPRLREGRLEALKMAACLDARLWKRYRRGVTLEEWIRSARALKAKVCARDPYEREGYRRVLNFGHTFGHVFESLSRFRLSHGDAVGLGIRCALEVGRALEITPEEVAKEIDAGLDETGALPRAAITPLLRGRLAALGPLLAADKKSEGDGLRMVLVPALGRFEIVSVRPVVWKALARGWARSSA